MKMTDLLKKVYLDNKEFLTAEDVRRYCKPRKLDYDNVIKYFEERGYFVRIFRGIFYVRSPEEIRLGRARYNHLELVAKGLELKDVKKWYFGLHTALKINNMTHEHFTIEDVLNDSIFRPKPMTIAGYRFKFTKVSPSLFDFGIKEKKSIRYSDPEKTILDFAYIWRYNGMPTEKIAADVSDWAKDTSKKKLDRYASKYPKSVARIVEMI